MILVLGAACYIGRIFITHLRRRGHDFIPLAHKDYSDFDLLFDNVRKVKPEFIINAASYACASDADVFELAREETLHINAILPHIISKVCLMTNTPWGHVSSGCIYSGAKIAEGGMIIEKKISRLELLRLLAASPEKLHGYTETDDPNFSFRDAPCSFFSGTMALAEEAIRGVGRNYIWRMGVPFNEREEPENFLCHLQNSEKIYDGVHPLSHTDDFVRACLDLWEQRAAFGIYNIVNPGVINTAQIVRMLQRKCGPGRQFEFWADDAEFYRDGSHALRSNCVLDISKLLAVGVTVRPAQEALEDALSNWRVQEPPRSAAA